MRPKTASQLIDQRIRDLGGWRGRTLARMRGLILEADPGIVEEWKWVKTTHPGTPVWSRGGIVCTGEAYTKVVKLTFARGAELPDPARLFNASLEGRTRRAIDIHEGEEVDGRAFAALVKAAVARNLRAKKRPATLVLAVLLAGTPATAQEERSVSVHGIVDARIGRSDAPRGWLDGGLGKVRYGATAARPDETAAFAALSQASLVVDARASEVLGAHVQVNLDAEPDPTATRAHAGLVEAFLRYAPEPTPWLRVQARAGLFFPPISLEHTGVAWSTVHTLTPSAINTWVGEEVRAAGAELRASARAGQHDVSVVGAVFGDNDPAGTLLSWRGWALHDRQTAAGERVPLADIPSLRDGGIFGRLPRWSAPIREVDGRLGYYAGAAWRLVGRAEVQALFLDNNGDPAAFDGFQYGWHTESWSAGTRLRLGRVELVGQWMDGTTQMGLPPGQPAMVENAFRSLYGLATAKLGRHRLTARYDAFEVEDLDPNRAADANDEDGHAWTVAYAVTLGDSAHAIAEWVRVESDRAVRAQLGDPLRAAEDQLQVAVRFVF